MTLIDESVSVSFFSNHLKHTNYPAFVYWRGRRYAVTKVGLHHTIHEGRTLVHVFSVSDGVSFFRLEFDTTSLNWKLKEIGEG